MRTQAGRDFWLIHFPATRPILMHGLLGTLAAVALRRLRVRRGVTVVALHLIPERYSGVAFVIGAIAIPGIAHYR